MERIEVLIEKLGEQRKQNASVDQMLMTVQLLQSELASKQKTAKVLGTSKVSVILPVTHIITQVEEKPVASNAITEAPIVIEVQQSFVPEPPQPASIPLSKPVSPEETIPKPVEYQLQKPKVEIVPEPLPAAHAPYYNGYGDTAEAPTLVQQQIHKEVHEIITNHQESLNDKLKEDRTEVAHKLKDTPVKDLRKAIGINDKFTLINELFRGDEAMYERSIKTINGFHILQEAEYWINRELKVKLGWNDSKENVQHFYQLVRRRFS
jgi:hypothetical protein